MTDAVGISHSGSLRRPVPAPSRELIAVVLAGTIGVSLWVLPADLSVDGRKALIVTVLAVIGWAMTRLSDSFIAISAALALVLTDTISDQQLFSAMGQELVWLLVAAFVIAAVLKKSGLTERVVAIALAPFRTFASAVFALTALIAATAFFIPSTSGRAALLLPVFLALTGQMPDARLVRPLGLLFPTVILLSAGGSLLGAGAHLIAVEAIARADGPQIGYIEWIALAFPASMISCLIAARLILAIFVPADLREAPLQLARPQGMMTSQQKRVAVVLGLLVASWITTPVHGLSIVLITLAGALTLLTRPFTKQKTKDIFKGVDMELILYLTATIVIADAMITTGADRWLAAGAISVLPERLAENRMAAVVFMTSVAVLSHLFITSRSARAAVLIPAVALPIAAFGHDPTLIVMLAVLGTGFCQTMMASAKPVAIYGSLDVPTFTQSDLLRLAVPLMPAVALPLVFVALTVWPYQLGLSVAMPQAQAAATALPAASPAELMYSDQVDMSVADSGSALAPARSLRPPHRPEGFEAQARKAETRTYSAQTRDVPAQRSVGAQFRRDLNQAARDLRRMGRALGFR